MKKILLLMFIFISIYTNAQKNDKYEMFIKEYKQNEKITINLRSCSYVFVAASSCCYFSYCLNNDKKMLKTGAALGGVGAIIWIVSDVVEMENKLKVSKILTPTPEGIVLSF